MVGDPSSTFRALFDELTTLRKGDGAFAAKISSEDTPTLVALPLVQTYAASKGLTLKEAAWAVLVCVGLQPSLGHRSQPIIWRTFNFDQASLKDLSGRRLDLRTEYRWEERSYRQYEADAMVQYATHLRTLRQSPCEFDTTAENNAAWTAATLRIAQLERENMAFRKIAKQFAAVYEARTEPVGYTVRDRKGATPRTRRAIQQITEMLPDLSQRLGIGIDETMLQLRAKFDFLLERIERYWYPDLYVDEPPRSRHEVPPPGIDLDMNPIEADGDDRVVEARHRAWRFEGIERRKKNLAALTAIIAVVERADEWERVLDKPQGHGAARPLNVPV